MARVDFSNKKGIFLESVAFWNAEMGVEEIPWALIRSEFWLYYGGFHHAYGVGSVGGLYSFFEYLVLEY